MNGKGFSAASIFIFGPGKDFFAARLLLRRLPVGGGLLRRRKSRPARDTCAAPSSRFTSVSFLGTLLLPIVKQDVVRSVSVM